MCDSPISRMASPYESAPPSPLLENRSLSTPTLSPPINTNRSTPKSQSLDHHNKGQTNPIDYATSPTRSNRSASPPNHRSTPTNLDTPSPVQHVKDSISTGHSKLDSPIPTAEENGCTDPSPNTSSSILNDTTNASPSTQQFCLRWNNYQSNLMSVFDQLLQSESFVDVTLTCNGHSIKAHKIVLSACSPYFQSLFIDNPCQHPVIIMRDVEWPELKAAVEFMYKGEINVCRDQIGPLLRVAEMLKIRGLADVNGDPDLGSVGFLHAMNSTDNLGIGRAARSPVERKKTERPSKKPKLSSNSSTKDVELARSVSDTLDSIHPAVSPPCGRKRPWAENHTSSSSLAGSPIVNRASLTPDHQFGESHSPFPSSSPASHRSAIVPGMHHLFQQQLERERERERERCRDQQDIGDRERDQQRMQQFHKQQLKLQNQLQLNHEVSITNAVPKIPFGHAMQMDGSGIGLGGGPMRLPVGVGGGVGGGDDMEIKPEIAEMIREEEMAKLMENPQGWFGASTSASIADSYQYQLQSMWQKCWNTNQGLFQHQRFRERGPLKSWRPETMADAICSVLKDGLTLSQAARKYDIPYPTFVLYANRVHNMLGPSMDGGFADLRPKGRGRPQRILLGLWTDEHINGVIRTVVYRDPKEIKDEIPFNNNNTTTSSNNTIINPHDISNNNQHPMHNMTYGRQSMIPGIVQQPL